MRVNGRTIKLLGRENCNTSTVIFTTESGETTKQKALGFISTQTARSMKGSGKMTNSMGREKRPGKMGQFTSVSFNMEKSVVKGR